MTKLILFSLSFLTCFFGSHLWGQEVANDRDTKLKSSLRALLMGSNYEVAERLMNQASPEILQSEYKGWSFLSRVIGGQRIRLVLMGNRMEFSKKEEDKSYGGDKTWAPVLTKILLEKGADPNFSGDAVASTPFKQAIRYRLYDVADMLAEYGADFTHQEVLEWAEKYNADQSWLKKFMVEHKFDLDSPISEDVTLRLALQFGSIEERGVAFERQYPWGMDLSKSQTKPELLTALQGKFSNALLSRVPAIDQLVKQYYGKLQNLAAQAQSEELRRACQIEQALSKGLEFSMAENSELRELQWQHWKSLKQIAANEKASIGPLLKIYLDELLKLRETLIRDEQLSQIDHIWQSYNRFERLLIESSHSPADIFESHGLQFYAKKIVFVVCSNDLKIGRYGVPNFAGEVKNENHPRLINLAQKVISNIPEGISYQILVAGGPAYWEGSNVKLSKNYCRTSGRGFSVDWGRTSESTYMPRDSIDYTKFPVIDWITSAPESRETSVQFLQDVVPMPGRDDLTALYFAGFRYPEAIVVISEDWATTEFLKGKVIKGEKVSSLVSDIVKFNRSKSNTRIFSISLDSPWLPELTNRSFGDFGFED